MNGTWSADPWGRFPYRWFDGTTWTALVFDGATQYLDPYVTQVMINPVGSGVGATVAGATPGAGAVPPGVPMPAPTVTAPPMHAGAPMPTYVVVAPGYPSHVVPGVASPSVSVASPSSAVSAPVASTTEPTARTAPTTPPTAARTATTTDSMARAVDPTCGAGTARTGDERSAGSVAGGGARARATRATGSPTRDAERRPWWVPALGTIAVVGLAWWLFNLGDGDERSTSAVADQGATDTTVDEVTTTVVVSTLPTATATATVPATVAPAPTVTTVAGPDPALVQDCVDFVPAAAYIGDAGATDLWNAAGFDVQVLRDLCAALPDWRLGAIAQQRDDLDLALTGSTAVPATTAAASPEETTPDGVVPVSPTMPPPLPSTAP